MNWLKENWFKLIIAFAVLLIGFSIFYYVIFLPNRSQKEKPILKESELPSMSVIVSPSVSPSLNIEKKAPVATNNNLLIKSQIAAFEGLLSQVSESQLNCEIAGGYNYMKLYGTESEKEEVRSNNDTIRAKCFKYITVRNYIYGLVAEPELVAARRKITELADNLEGLGRYVLLENGYSEKIDIYSKKMDSLLVEAREEILLVKRQNRLQ